jgi:hypothetical protein
MGLYFITWSEGWVMDDRDLLKIAGGVILAVVLGFAVKAYYPVYEVRTKLQDIAKVPDSVRIDEYERKNGVICGRWSANNPFGQRISTRFVYVESIKSLSVEPERAYSPEDELLHSMFLSSWRGCDGS